MKKQTKSVQIGEVTIGGTAPISIQSMTNTDTRNVEATVRQIKRLEEVGCELVRVAIPDYQAATKVDQIQSKIEIPLIADIHFDHQLALEVLERGIAGLRINPGNIGGVDKVKQVALEAARQEVPIRVGVNAGSLDQELLAKYGHPTAEAMVESALEHIEMLERFAFEDIIISLKASDVMMTIKAYQQMANQVDYPLHVGITEAGTVRSGAIKSAVGVGSILAQGLGDTIRISLTGDPVEEVKVGYEILKSLGLRDKGPRLVSCPTCGRCQIELVEIANQVEERLASLDQPLEVAVMGCAVNGPGEAREADIGIAGGHQEGLIFKEGEILKKVPGDKLIDELMEEVYKIIDN
ncbi:flavodoxin-dependent (E)-4-hydroxy-3-methylbut-2-enyl-diphosphate synthase [Halanaerobaculum tunisiense]